MKKRFRVTWLHHLALLPQPNKPYTPIALPLELCEPDGKDLIRSIRPSLLYPSMLLSDQQLLHVNGYVPQSLAPSESANLVI
ncbi:hypothetical protein SDC9_104163 [bioreactor metagenome]|uniref:Uncharacterized protein n=1 Tax=bioreactor metagenome TaxID=1076179 RepID=A0A645AYE9_9ZZZZ